MCYRQIAPQEDMPLPLGVESAARWPRSPGSSAATGAPRAGNFDGTGPATRAGGRTPPPEPPPALWRGVQRRAILPRPRLNFLSREIHRGHPANAEFALDPVAVG
jgi:hypothetical protein